MMSNEDNERTISCDGKGCNRYFFITGSCSITEAQLDVIGKTLGWTFQGEDEAYCPHCRAPVDQSELITGDTSEATAEDVLGAKA
jgi:hypothetical protein